MNFLDIDESDGEDESSDLNIINPDLVDFNLVSDGDSNHTSVLLATVESLLVPPEEFILCSLK